MRSLTRRGIWLSVVLSLLICANLSAQGNCAAFPEGSNEQRACEYGHKAIEYKQGSRESLMLFDSALLLNPDYAWAWYEKSVPFLKRGYLTKGMNLLNKAVELDPLNYLCYRAYWYFQHKSFAYAMTDLTRYYAMEDAYQQNTPGGAVDMRIILGIAHAHQGAYDKAIEIVTEVIESYPTDDYAGPYDFHTLGVLYLEKGRLDEAREALIKSIMRNEQFADTYYYLSVLAKQEGQLTQAKSYIKEALSRYEGEEYGYSGYPFCFPVAKEEAEKMTEALGIGN